MGVSGLLPQLRSITRKQNVTSYRGKTVAVDAYCWLHKGAYSCARELVEGQPTDAVIKFCMSRLDVMLRGGVTPYVVFDGGPLPGKDEEERARKSVRQENKERARALWQQGNKAAAMDCYQKAVDITPMIAKDLIEALKRRGVLFVVAPYEADAQMAYLALNGLVDVVLTEDSDLLAYRCPIVFFKMDKEGWGEEVALAELPMCRELAFSGWTHDLFQQMCAMAGCDFVRALPGIGIKKAHAHIRRTRDFRRAVRALRFDGVQVPAGYEAAVQRALWTFRHQRVYCPTRRETVALSEPPGGGLAAQAAVPSAAELQDGEPDFLGAPLPPAVAQAIAVGDVDPVTKLPFPSPDASGSGTRSELPGSQGAAQSAVAPRCPAEAPNPACGQPGFRPLTAFPGFVHITSQSARNGFKRPRTAAGEDGGEQERAPRPRQPRLPAAHASGRSRAPAALLDGHADPGPLGTTLWEALQQRDEEEDEEEHEQERSLEESLEGCGDEDQLGAAHADGDNADHASDPSQQSLGCRTLAQWHLHAAAAVRPPQPHLQVLPATGLTPAGPNPPQVSPGFYGDLEGYDTDSSLQGLPAREPPGTPAAWQQLPAHDGRAAHDSLAQQAAPGGRPLGGNDSGYPVDPISDLSYLPAFKAEAKAAVAAVVERAEGRRAAAAVVEESAGRLPFKAAPDFSKFAFRSRTKIT